MAVVDPELFADGACGRPLPAGEVLQEFRFGQFSSLNQLTGGVENPVIVGRRRRRHNEPQTFRHLIAAQSAAEAEPVPIAELLTAGADAPHDTDASNGAEAANGEGRSYESALMGGLAELAPREPRAPREPNGGGGGGGEGGGGGSGPGPKVVIRISHQVPEAELEAWLAAPWAMDHGVRVDLTLTAGDIADLRGKGTTVVTTPDYKVTVTVLKAPKTDPTPPGGGTGGSSTGGASTGGSTTTSDPPHRDEDDEDYDPDRTVDLPGDDEVIIAVYFEWVQSWTLKGFSRGRMLQSLALAPQEDATIELFTWDRRTGKLEQLSEMESDQTIEAEDRTQDATECMRELTKKTEFELSAGGSVDAHYNGGTVQVGVLVEGKVADKTNVDDVVKSTTKTLNEGLHRSVTRVKTRRSSKITETTETGSEERITRRVRNANLCHTLNLDYYEILTHYQVRTRFNEDGMRFCAMILNPVAEKQFPRAFIRRHEGPLRDALLDRSLATGFDALRFLRARDVALAELAERRKRREPEPLKTAPAQPPAPQPLTEEESAANNYLATLQRAAQGLMKGALRTSLHNVFQALDRHETPLAGDLDAGKHWLAQQLFLRSFSQLSLELQEIAKAKGPLSIRDWGPRLDPLMPAPSAMPKPSQLNLEPQETKEGLLSPQLKDWVGAPWNWGWWWGEIKRVGLFEPEDAGLGATAEQFGKVYRDFLEAQKRKGAVAAGQALVDQAAQTQDQLSDEDRLESDFPLRDYAMSQERAEVLQLHLREHAAHYSFALFQSLPPQEQLNDIEQAMAGIEVPFAPGYFQPRAVGQIGRRLLIPLNDQVIPFATAMLADLKLRIDVPDQCDTVMLPSPGMTIESRLGRCSAAEEFIEQTRRLDLELREVEVLTAKAEAQRLELRLKSTPPLLDDPGAPVPQPSS